MSLSENQQILLALMGGAVWVFLVATLASFSYRIKELEVRVNEIETEVRPTGRDGFSVWHFSSSPGVRRCGNDEPNTASTSIRANATCVDCLRLIAVDRC